MSPDLPTEEPAAARVARWFSQNHFSHTVGLELIEAEPGMCRIGLELTEGHRQGLGFVHGGVLATIADVAMGFAASSLQGPTTHVVTGELKISYLNPAVGERLIAHGYTLKAGRKVVFVEADVHCLSADGTSVLVAKASSSMIVVARADVAAAPSPAP